MRAMLLAIPFLLAPLPLAGSCGEREAWQVDDATYRAPLTTGGVGVAYFSIMSAKADRIISISSTLADRVELHATIVKDGMATMQKLDSVELPAGQTVEFKPGGMHVMVFTPQPIAADATFPIQIGLQSGRTETLSLRQSSVGETKK